jgi:hypothetical protein
MLSVADEATAVDSTTHTMAHGADRVVVGQDANKGGDRHVPPDGRIRSEVDVAVHAHARTDDYWPQELAVGADSCTQSPMTMEAVPLHSTDG